MNEECDDEYRYGDAHNSDLQTTVYEKVDPLSVNAVGDERTNCESVFVTSKSATLLSITHVKATPFVLRVVVTTPASCLSQREKRTINRATESRIIVLMKRVSPHAKARLIAVLVWNVSSSRMLDRSLSKRLSCPNSHGIIDQQDTSRTALCASPPPCFHYHHSKLQTFTTVPLPTTSYLGTILPNEVMRKIRIGIEQDGISFQQGKHTDRVLFPTDICQRSHSLIVIEGDVPSVG